MGPSKVATSEVIAVIEPGGQRCYLTNSRKQVYTLNIEKVDHAHQRLGLSRPRGRRNPIDPEETWAFSFRDGDGAYHCEQLTLVPGEAVIWVPLPAEMDFLIRRRSIRLSAGGRNPTGVSFDHGIDHLDGLLVDISLDGLGIQLNTEPTVDCPLAVEDAIANTRFALRSRPICIHAAKVAHICRTDGDWRVGLQFVQPSEEEVGALQELIHNWHMTQRASRSS